MQRMLRAALPSLPSRAVQPTPVLTTQACGAAAGAGGDAAQRRPLHPILLPPSGAAAPALGALLLGFQSREAASTECAGTGLGLYELYWSCEGPGLVLGPWLLWP